ncbi:MAG: ATP synthase subunit I [Spirochaeta sp.]
MIHFMEIAYGLPIGIVAGVLFFGGLRVTIRYMTSVKYPAFLFGVSFLVRLAAALSAFFLVSQLGGWQAMLSTLAGFVAVQIFYIRREGGENAERH